MALHARGDGRTLVKMVGKMGQAGGVLAALAIAGAAMGQPGRTPPKRDDSPDPRIVTETGQTKAVWPTPPRFDHLHMKLDVTFTDLMSCKMTGVEELSVTPRGSKRDTLVLDCGKQITVDKVEVNGRTVKHSHENGKLTIELGREYEPGEKLTVVTTYSVDFTKERGEGLTLVKPRENAESPTDNSPCIYSQGEAQSNSHWFPCHDFPNERLTTEIIAHVPDGYTVSSNGHLVEKVGEKDGMVRWHWLQDKPHVNYLVTIVIGKYSIISLDKPGSTVDLGHKWKEGEFAPVIAFVPVGREKQAQESLGNTPDMIRMYERLFKQQYAWDKYAQVLVRGFNGGMENTSATTEYAAVLRGERGDQDDLISHELAHQWFGDLMTCRTWEHIWLNEGWATYCEALWNEEKARKAGGDDGKADDAYMKTVTGFYRQQRNNHASSPHTPAMVSNRYTSPDEVFQKADNPYPKGGMILHMLRERLGDDAFFRGVQLYISRHRYGLVETDMFRRALEDASGQSLERFFDQWCVRPGAPGVDVEVKWADGELTVKAEQTQTVNAENPAYAFTLPLYVKFEDGSRETLDFDMDAKEASKTYKLKGKPKDVVVDPRCTVLAGHDVKKELSMWIEQLNSAPTITARMEAANHLAESGEMAAREALASVASRANEDADLRGIAERAISATASAR